MSNPFPCPDLRNNRLRPDHVLAAVAHLIGFHPSDSMLCVFLDAEQQVSVTARLDWDICRTDPVASAEALGVPARNAGSVAAFLVTVDPKVEDPAALAAARSRLEELDYEVIWAGHLRGDVWRGMHCDSGGCPEHRLDRASPSPIVATLVAGGRAPSPDRRTVVAEVASTRTGRVSTREVASVGPNDDLEGWRDRTLARVMDLLADTSTLTSADVALLCAACRDIRVRDVVLWRLTVAPEHLLIGWHRAWQVFAEVLRRCPRSHAAPVGAVTALIAWQLGDGTRALECLDRATEADPEHSLAELVGHCVRNGIPPQIWHMAMSSMDEEIARHGDPVPATVPSARGRIRRRHRHSA